MRRERFLQDPASARVCEGEQVSQVERRASGKALGGQFKALFWLDTQASCCEQVTQLLGLQFPRGDDERAGLLPLSGVQALCAVEGMDPSKGAECSRLTQELPSFPGKPRMGPRLSFVSSQP